MAEVKYNEVQIHELLNNKYVKSCTNKTITFTKECKIKVIELSKQGIFYRDIFKQLCFPEYIINSKIPERSYNRWKRNMKFKGMIEGEKGRKKKEKIDISKMTKDEELEYLRAKVLYLEEIEKYIKCGLP